MVSMAAEKGEALPSPFSAPCTRKGVPQALTRRRSGFARPPTKVTPTRSQPRAQYANGHGMSQDYAQAYMWLTNAAVSASDAERYKLFMKDRDLVAAKIDSGADRRGAKARTRVVAWAMRKSKRKPK